MITYLCRGIAVGLLFGIPAGAVGAMTAQRTWTYGMRAGLLTGLGSSVADCLYASVGAFGLTVISDFLLRIQTVIYLAGGCLILLMGVRLLTGVFVGTYLWWGTLTGAVLLLKKKAKRMKMRTVNRIFGVLLSGFGIAVFVNGIL